MYSTLEKQLLGGANALEFLNVRQDDATPAQRIIEWNGFKIGLQYLPFQTRHGRTLTSGYGYFQKTKGADNMALDVYVGTKLESPKIYAIAQFINGAFDEEKLVIGVDTEEEARNIYLGAMPAVMFGGIRELTLDQLGEYRVDTSAIHPVKSKEDIRRDFAAGLLSRADALQMLGYDGAENLAERADSELAINLAPMPLPPQTPESTIS